MPSEMDRGALRRQALPVFRNAFRPFFLGGAVWAACLVPLWVAEYLGLPALAGFSGRGLTGHTHEMLFGFLSAIMCGFILTAIPNWTGRAPVAGVPLALLWGLWLVGRAVSLAATGLLSIAVECTFLLVLTGVVLREIAVGRNWRNLPVAGLVAGYALVHLASHWPGVAAGATRGALAIIVLLLALIGGRIVPSFTRNWLAASDSDAAGRVAPPMQAFDKMSILLLALALAGWVFPAPGLVSGPLLLLAAGAQGYRLSRWQGDRTLAEPLMWSLHLGYAWMPVGLALLGAGLIWPAAIPTSVGLHAVAAGLIGAMTLAVMTRASLGHTGRERRADASTFWIFGLVHLGAIARVVAALMANCPVLLGIAAVLWSSAFALFAIAYAPMLFGRPPVSESTDHGAP